MMFIYEQANRETLASSQAYRERMKSLKSSKQISALREFQCGHRRLPKGSPCFSNHGFSRWSTWHIEIMLQVQNSEESGPHLQHFRNVFQQGECGDDGWELLDWYGLLRSELHSYVVLMPYPGQSLNSQQNMDWIWWPSFIP